MRTYLGKTSIKDHGMKDCTGDFVDLIAQTCLEGGEWKGQSFVRSKVPLGFKSCDLGGILEKYPRGKYRKN